MTYSWHNIKRKCQNNTVRYSVNDGGEWSTITFEDGTYSHNDINECIHTKKQLIGTLNPMERIA